MLINNSTLNNVLIFAMTIWETDGAGWRLLYYYFPLGLNLVISGRALSTATWCDDESFHILSLQYLFNIDPSEEGGQLVMKIGEIEIYEIQWNSVMWCTQIGSF